MGTPKIIGSEQFTNGTNSLNDQVCSSKIAFVFEYAKSPKSPNSPWQVICQPSVIAYHTVIPISHPNSSLLVICVLDSPLRDPSTIGLGFLTKDTNQCNSVGGDFISASQRIPRIRFMASFPCSFAPLRPPPPGNGREGRRKERIKAVTFSHPWTNRGHAGTRDPTC